MNGGRIVSTEFPASTGKIRVISSVDLISYTYRFPSLSHVSHLDQFQLACGVSSVLHTGGLDIVIFYLGLLKCIREWKLPVNFISL